MKNIVLIGFMGAGKTTYGRKLSSLLGCKFIDTDRYIEKKIGLSISEIFAIKGEAAFRQMELDTACQLAEENGIVIATGGGMIKSSQIMQRLKKNGVVLYLKSTPAAIYRNIGHDTRRPLLEGGDKMERITSLMKERAPIYETYADITIDVSGGRIGRMVEEMLEALKKEGAI